MAKLFTGKASFGFAFNQTGAQPLDDRSVVQSYAELLKADTFGAAIYNGMTVATVDEQKVYMLVDKTKATVAEGWKEVGAGGAVAVDTYAEAVVLATDDNIGQVIYVKTSDETYEQAPYIVTGAGKLQKLAASNSDGTGVEADVKKLQETVGDVNSGLVKEVSLKVNKSDFESYQGTVNGSLETKANAGDLTTHTSNGNIHVTLEEKGIWNNAESNANAYADANFVKKKGYVAYSNEEKTKLAGIAEGAQVNVIEGVQVDGVDLAVDGNKKVNIILTDYAKSADVYSKTDADNTFLKSTDYKEYDDTEVRNLITAEGTARKSLKTDLEGKITAEATARGELKTELEGKIGKAQTDAEKVATDFNTAMDGRMTTVEGKVATLEAINHEQLVKDAIDEFATKTSDDKIVNTFAELLEYAAEHSSEYADIYGEVQAMKTSKADQSALNALNAIVGKASVEGGESGSGLVKRIEDLEAIDHDAYKSADATLKAELQGEISKKADITALNNEVSAREALAAIVGAKGEGETVATGIFADLAALVAKDVAHDEVIATKAAKSELDTLAALVGTRAEGDSDDVFTKLDALASAVDGKLTKNATVNNIAFENGAVVIDAANITLDAAITRTEDEEVKTVYSADASIQSVLKSLSERIDVLDPNVSGELGITSITEGNGISASTVGGLATIAVKVSNKENNMLSVDGDGLFVQAIMVNGNDMEPEQ